MEKYAYKVVGENNGSCIIAQNSGFYLKYEKGKHVKALKGSLGVMVFPDMERANRFMKNIGHKSNCKVKRVIPIGTPTYPKVIVRNPRLIGAFNRMTSSKRASSIICMSPPAHTVCYPEVIVVD